MSNGMHPSTERVEIRQTADAPYLPHYGLTSVQVVCAIELSKGRKAVDIQKQFNISRDIWKRWVKIPAFTEHITTLLVQRAALVEEVLKEGELQAAATLLGSLTATTSMRHKDGKIREHPNWDVRVRAAISMLDRRGERGKPIERVMSKNTNFNTNEVRNELSQALADPAVRDFLASDPAFAQRLRDELKQLGPAEEPCDSTSPPSSSPSSAPVSGEAPSTGSEPPPAPSPTPPTPSTPAP